MLDKKVKELLEMQLDLLSEQSHKCAMPHDLCDLSIAMCRIAEVLNQQ